MSTMTENPEIAARVIAALVERLGGEVQLTELELNSVPALMSKFDGEKLHVRLAMKGRPQ